MCEGEVGMAVGEEVCARRGEMKLDPVGGCAGLLGLLGLLGASGVHLTATVLDKARGLQGTGLGITPSHTNTNTKLQSMLSLVPYCRCTSQLSILASL